MKLLILWAVWATVVAANIYSAPYELLYSWFAYKAARAAAQGKPGLIAAACSGSGPFGTCTLEEFAKATLKDTNGLNIAGLSDADIDKAANALRPPKIGLTRRMEAWKLLPTKFSQGDKAPRYQDVFSLIDDDLRQSRIKAGDSAIMDEVNKAQSSLERASQARMKDFAERHLQNIDKLVQMEKYSWKVARTKANNYFGDFDKFDVDGTRNNKNIPSDQLNNILNKLQDNTVKVNGVKVYKAYTSHLDALNFLGKMKDNLKNPPSGSC